MILTRLIHLLKNMKTGGGHLRSGITGGLCLLMTCTAVHAMSPQSVLFVPVTEHGAVAGTFPVFINRASADQATLNAAAVRQVVIVIHGRERNGLHYLQSLMLAAQAADRAGPDVLLAVPQFSHRADVKDQNWPDNLLTWKGNSWMGGGGAQKVVQTAGEQTSFAVDAADESGPSSFVALNSVLSYFSDRQRFPALERVTLFGFSAGAQVVQRYAYVRHNNRAAKPPVNLIVASPSSWLYPNAERPGQNASTLAQMCPEYDDWKYGWKKVPAAVREMLADNTDSRSTAIAGGKTDAPQNATPAMINEAENRYNQQSITYFVGGNDNNPHQNAMDKSCSGFAQGSNRLERAQNWVADHNRRAAVDSGSNVTLYVVPGVAHDARKMMATQIVRQALFGPAP